MREAACYEGSGFKNFEKLKSPFYFTAGENGRAWNWNWLTLGLYGSTSKSWIRVFALIPVYATYAREKLCALAESRGKGVFQTSSSLHSSSNLDCNRKTRRHYHCRILKETEIKISSRKKKTGQRLELLSRTTLSDSTSGLLILLYRNFVG